MRAMRTTGLPSVTAAILFSFAWPSAAAEMQEMENRAAQFAQALFANCFPDMERQVQHHTISFTRAGADAAEQLLLTQVPCNLGAYNSDQYWLLTRDPDSVEILSFARPELAISYSDTDSASVSSLEIAGFPSSTIVPNSDYDPDTRSIGSFSKWRGLGDASSSGRWEFRDGSFMLREYHVDASYDGEINPVTVVADGLVQK